MGAASTVSGALAYSEPAVTLWEDMGPRPHHNADVFRTPGVDFGKYGDASMRTEDPSLVRACGCRIHTDRSLWPPQDLPFGFRV